MEDYVIHIMLTKIMGDDAPRAIYKQPSKFCSRFACYPARPRLAAWGVNIAIVLIDASNSFKHVSPPTKSSKVPHFRVSNIRATLLQYLTSISD